MISDSLRKGFVGSGAKALVAAAMLAAAQGVWADTLAYDGPWFSPYYGTYTISDTNPSPGVDVTAYAGAFKMTDTNTNNTFMAWCVDIYDNMNTQSPWASYTLTSGADFYGAGSHIITDLERLASYASDNGLLTGSAASAAFQLAVWEIVNEASGSYGLSTGDFQVTNSSTVRNTADSWLSASAGWGIDQQLSIWQQDVAHSTQNLAVFAPVPEPGIVVMLISGLGLMSFVARRRKKARDGEQ
jgi:PEP-CTERM motif